MWAKSIIRQNRSIAPLLYSSLSCQSWNINSYGGIDSLTLSTSSIPPITRKDHVLVKVKAASVNPLDLLMIEGYGQRVFENANKIKNFTKTFGNPQFPLTPGRDFSGVVFDVGQECENFKVGDQVWGSLDVFERRGSHSGFVTIQESLLSHRPEGLSHAEAASLPFVTNTFFFSLEMAGIGKDLLGPNSRCLVLGAAGGIGSFAVQYLKHLGLCVVGTCRTRSKQFLRSLGADGVVDSSDADSIGQINGLAGEGFDYVLNFLPTTDDALLGMIKCRTSAKFVSTSSPIVKNIDSRGVCGAVESFYDVVSRLVGPRKFIYGFFRPDARILDYVGGLVSANRIKCVVDSIYGMESLPEAYRRVRGGGLQGKVVVDVDNCSAPDLV